MNNIYFQPWIGAEYKKGWNGLRTLVMGESHYEWEEAQSLKSTLTIDCIDDQINGGNSKQFWTNIAVAFMGHVPTISEKRSFWNSVAFYNFIQESVGFGSRVRPTPDMWKNARVPFSKILETHRPQFLVVMGKQVWNSLPELNGYYGPSIDGAPTPRTWIYPISESENCLVFPLRHPSAGFSGSKFHPYLLRAHIAAQSLTAVPKKTDFFANVTTSTIPDF